jgi:hypothetical protein
MCEDGQTYCKTQDVCVDTTECTGNCEHWNSNTCSCEYKCTAEQNCCPQSSVCTAPCEDGKVWNSSACWCVEAP